MIDDLEMRELFRVESDEHLQCLDGVLLNLEKDPDDKALLEEAFREVHSLKGAARMLGLASIEAVAHRFEDILGKATKGQIPLTAEMTDSLYGCLDALRKLAEEALTGVPSGVVVADVLALLRPEVVTPQPEAVPEKPPLPVDYLSYCDAMGSDSPDTGGEHVTVPTGSAEDDPHIAATPSVTGFEPFQIETIRVQTRKLDSLMTQAGELAVAKQRIARRCADLDELLGKWECVSGELRGCRGKETGVQRGIEEFAGLLERVKKAVYEDNSRLDSIAGQLEDGIRAIRLLPLSTVLNLFPRMVKDLSRERSKEVELVVSGDETAADKRILEEMKAPLMHIIRNAVDHGIESPEERVRHGKPRCGTISIRAYQRAGHIHIEVKDDGRGLNNEKIRLSALKSRKGNEEELARMSPEQVQSLIFSSGLSTSPFISDVSGRGVGLDVVRFKVERLKGEVAVDSVQGAGCTIRIKLPISMATLSVLIIKAGGIEYALPFEYVLRSYPLRQGEIFTIDGREAFIFEERTISIARLSELLQFKRADFLPSRKGADRKEGYCGGEMLPCVVVRVGEEKFGLLADDLLEEQDILLKPQSSLLKHVRGLAGATILGSGKVCMVLHPPDLLLSLRRQGVQITPEAPGAEFEEKKAILVAEDSLTTRTQLKRILEGNGYEVVTAVDGQDAFVKLGSWPFAALVSDINMPNMDGLTLTTKVRQNKKYSELPIILVTMLASDQDKRRGLEAGANAYITKPAFDQKLLLDTLRRLT